MNIVIELKSMKFFAYHGVSEQEKKVGNIFLVDLTYSLPVKKVFISDSLSDTISYESVFNLVKQEMLVPSKLLEHVAGRIVNLLKQEYPQITYLKLKISKQKPPLNGEVLFAAVIVEKQF